MVFVILSIVPFLSGYLSMMSLILKIGKNWAVGISGNFFFKKNYLSKKKVHDLKKEAHMFIQKWSKCSRVINITFIQALQLVHVED